MSAEDGDDIYAEARHRAAHDLASPVRGVAIVADLLSEAIAQPTVDLQLVATLADQLQALSSDASERLTAFAKGPEESAVKARPGS